MSIAGSSLVHGSANGSIRDFFGATHTPPEVLLWQAVLMCQVRDLFLLQVVDKGDRGQLVLKSRECVEAETWIGAFPSHNFNTVCALAGFDARAAHERLRRIMALPDAIRAQYSFSSMRDNAADLWAKIHAHEASQEIKEGGVDLA
jgi:hypothetical protein